MIVIYAEKASLAKAIAVALKAGNRIAHPKEPTIGHYEFTFNGEKTILCHGVGHLCGLVDAEVYGEQYAVWNTDPKAEIEDTTVLLDVNGNTFKSSGSVITNNGWYEVDALPDKKATLPPVSEGESYQGKYELKQGFTEPPKPYTESDLITAMETAGKHLEDEEARALMKAENKGLGTPATRAGIINALFHNGYLTKQGKSIMPTAKGVFQYELLKYTFKNIVF